MEHLSMLERVAIINRVLNSLNKDLKEDKIESAKGKLEIARGEMQLVMDICAAEAGIELDDNNQVVTDEDKLKEELLRAKVRGQSGLDLMSGLASMFSGAMNTPEENVVEEVAVDAIDSEPVVETAE